MKRLLSAGLSVLLLAGALSGCGTADSQSGESTDSSTGTVQTVAASGDYTSILTDDTTDNNAKVTSDGDGGYTVSGTLDDVTAAVLDGTETISQLVTTTYSARDLSGEEYDNATEVTLSDEDYTITAAGTYIFTGTLADGQIVVAASDSDKVQIVLNGVTITCSDGPAINIQTADKVFLTLAEDSVNTLTDGSSYTLADGEDEPNACVYSKSDLTINGSGTLIVTGNYKHGIVSKDDLTIASGTIQVTAVNDGIKGKDCVQIVGGLITVDAGDDGIVSNNDSDTSKGYVAIDGGAIVITAGCDGIQAETVLQMTSGSVTITSGGGSANASTTDSGQANSGWGNWGADQSSSTSTDDTASAKGMKGGTAVLITGGTITIDSSDDSVHTNGDGEITGGTLTLSSGDDGVHADDALVITNGTITVSKSYEGLEGSSVSISGGTISVVSSDDGINAAGGSDTGMASRPGANSFDSDSSIYINVSGGTTSIVAGGDGVDSNGTLYVSGGELYVEGDPSSDNGALDFNGTAQITGGTVVALGGTQWTDNFGDTSTQYDILWVCDSATSGSDTLTVTDSSGNVVISYTPSSTYQYQSVIVSSPSLTQGETYTLTAGDQSTEVTLDSIITTSGSTSSGGMNGGGQMGGGGMPGGGGGGGQGGGGMPGGGGGGQGGGAPAAS